MPTTDRNRTWGLDNFLDSLVRDLDGWQETLAVKGITRPLTYTIQDVALDLRCFPQYDGDEVRFVTAGPGQEGASSLRFLLGSITSSSIRDTAPAPVSRDDTVIEVLDIEPEAKAALTKAGIRTARDLERVQSRNVDIATVTSGKVRDYSDLADLINKSRRDLLRPTVTALSMSPSGLVLRGENLGLGLGSPAYPKASVSGRDVPVTEATEHRLVLGLSSAPKRSSRVEVALDPYAVISLEVGP
ncbi:hypothetical protein [Ornithinimicrobium sufpigmenti]|uniref:hypothetical protein n=1 Tax=Ornithinimicrobium sufpigmenti TaxID=2508882 RepID=UPI00103556D6|nr:MULTISPECIES: hypothetical protein [unclassified Ornithinimicrobium]